MLKPSTQVDPGYFRYFFKSVPYITALRATADFIRDGQDLNFDNFAAVPLPLMPIDEQAAIARFLAWVNGRLERAIRAKRKVIALQEEHKQGVIHRAVTLGLNQAVMHKPTGVSCLGDIPRHWEQRALWTLSKLRAERNPTGLPLLSVFLDRGVIRYEDGGGQVHAPSLDLSNYQVVRAGDFVLNNQQAWRGSVGVSIHDGIISPAYFVLQLSGDLDSRYANHLMRSKAMVGQFVTSSKGVGDIQRSVFWPFLRMVQVPLPPIEEQRSIVRYIQKATASLDATIIRLDSEIGLLREYRTRLTADIVTGKLDVRDAARQLPDVPTGDAATEPDDDLDEPELDDEETTA